MLMVEQKLCGLIEFNPKVKLEKGEEYDFIPMENITPGEKFASVKEKKLWNGESGSKFEINDVLFARITPCLDNKKIAIARIDGKGFGSTEYFVLRAIPNISDKDFIYYLATTELLVQNAINSYVGASGRQRADLNYLKNCEIKIPNYEIQKKIAAILSAYDDLIENNKKCIQILEDMAEELYKEWFVRFRFPNWENTEFEKGIPKNWEITGFSELVSINPKESLDKNETYRFVGMEYLSTDSSFFYSDEYRLGNAGSKFRNGDILFPRITPCVENGKKGLVSTLKENEVACGSTEFIVFREKVLPKEYIYLLCKQSGFRQHAEQSMIGASGRQRITLNCFNKFYLPLPNNEILKEFTKHTKNYFHLIMELHMKNRKLAEVRDSLLPRLISGKLLVENLDIQFPSSI